MLNIKKNLKSSSIFRNLQPTTYHLKPSRGFTLIELLVVIAIIGILSSVVLVSLNSARSKGTDSAIVQDLGQIKTQAQIFMSDNSNAYGTTVPPVNGVAVDCTTAAGTSGSLFEDTKIKSQIDDAKTKSGDLTNACVSVDSTGGSNPADAWAVAQTLKSDPKKAWCVDSVNTAKEFTFTTDVSEAVSASAACN